MITPASTEKLATMSREEIVKAYIDLGFDNETAEAHTHVLLDGEGDTELPDSIILPVDKAIELGEAVGHALFVAEVRKAAESGVSFVEVTEHPDGDLEISQPDGVMVAWMVGTYPSLEVEGAGGVGNQHLTLAYLGHESDLSLSQKRTLIAVVNEVAQRHTRMHGVISGTGYFPDTGAWYAKVDVQGLEELRDDLVASLKDAGLPVVEDYDFTPHITMAYTDEEPTNITVAPFDAYVSDISAVVGGYKFDAALKDWEPGSHEYEPMVEDQHQTAFVPIIKSNEEKRFTLAPMYIPNTNDAHGDWAEPDDLQSALWDFQRGERTIALQHRPDLGTMGEAVEMMVIPWEMDVPMMKSDGTSYTQHFPANTPWLGVVWNENVWPLVKEGKVQGYSIGGKANLLDVKLPEADVRKSFGDAE